MLNLKFYNALDTEYEFLQHVSFPRSVCIGKVTLWFILFREKDIFYIFCSFCKKHDFELKILQRIRF